MERPRMANRVSTYPRLLIALLSVLSVGLTHLYAQTTSEHVPQSLEARLLDRAELLRVGEDAVFLFGVRNPDGEELQVDVPESSRDIQLIQLRVFPGRIEGVFDERWTAIELRLLPLRAGVFRYGPIVFSTGTRQGHIQSIRLDVLDDSLSAQTPRFIWFGLEAPLVEGAPRIIALVADRPLPAGGRVQLDIPQNTILENLPVDEAQRRRGVLARYSLLPIASGFIELGAGSVFIEGLEELPLPASKRVLVRPAVKESSASLAEAAMTETTAHTDEGSLQEGPSQEQREIIFPELSPRHTSWTVIAAPLVAEAKDRLEQEGFVEALAYLRRVERDSLLGFSLKGFREDLEELNGLPPAYAELWTPCWVISALIFVTILLFGVSFFAKLQKRPHFLRFFRMGVLCLGVILVLLAIRLDSAGVLGRGRKALIQQSLLYPVPVEGLAESRALRLEAGTSVRYHRSSDDWIFVILSDGRSGWTYAGAVYEY